MVKILSALIRFYKKLISPWLGPHCRFYPSCSSYFLQALETHGAAKGSYLGLKRLFRCHPFNEGGIDPVPASLCTHKQSLSTIKSPQTSESQNRITINKETRLRHGH